MATTKQAELVELLAREILAGSERVLDCVQRLSPKLERPVHMRAVADFFAGAARGESRRLVLSSAPRFGKTTAIEHSVAWSLFARPGVRVIVVCCTSALAEQISRRIRGLVQLLGLKIPHDQRAVDSWTATNGSSLRAIGTGGALVGVGADLLILDDVLPSMAAAQSATQREQVEEWMLTTALGRLEPNGSALVCMHRYSPDDISGRLIDRGWPVANVPALDMNGQSTWPSRWSTHALREKQAEVGPIAWAALYQGCPRPRGGSVFGALPTTYDPLDVRARFDAHTSRIAIACDPAATAKTSADASVIMVGAFHGGGKDLKLDILDVIKLRVEVPELVDRLAAVQRRWGAPVGVESVGGFRSVVQHLRRCNPDLQAFELRATTDKFTRSFGCGAAFSRGDIRWPPSAHWLADTLRELATFTGTGVEAHDDIADALVHLHSMGGLVAQAEIRRRRLAAIPRALPFG